MNHPTSSHSNVDKAGYWVSSGAGRWKALSELIEEASAFSLLRSCCCSTRWIMSSPGFSLSSAPIRSLLRDSSSKSGLIHPRPTPERKWAPKLSGRANLRPQPHCLPFSKSPLQMNLFAPLWRYSWRFRSFWRANDLPQIVHTKGRHPEWVRICSCNELARVNRLGQTLHWYIAGCFWIRWGLASFLVKQLASVVEIELMLNESEIARRLFSNLTVSTWVQVERSRE